MKDKEKQNEIPLEEQLMRRQSAPRPSVMDAVQKTVVPAGGQGAQLPDGMRNGFRALAQVIGTAPSRSR